MIMNLQVMEGGRRDGEPVFMAMPNIPKDLKTR